MRFYTDSWEEMRLWFKKAFGVNIPDWCTSDLHTFYCKTCRRFWQTGDRYHHQVIREIEAGCIHCGSKDIVYICPKNCVYGEPERDNARVKLVYKGFVDKVV